MTQHPPADDVRLARAWASRRGNLPSAACPSADDLWTFVAMELGLEQRLEIIDHLAQCPTCTEAVRIAAAQAGQRPTEAHSDSRWSGTLVGVGAAMMAAAAVVVLWRPAPPRAPGESDVYRGDRSPIVSSAIPSMHTLPRDDFRLRWTGGSDGTRYDLRVFDEDLRLLVSAPGLEGTEYTVDPAALETVAPGETLRWQLVARTPDGREAATPTWTATLR